MDAKTAKLVRENFSNAVEGLEILRTGFKFKGLTKEGSAFSDGVDTIIVKTIVKSEGFDLESALEEKAEADAKAADKATKAKSKAKAPAKKASNKEVDEVLDELMAE